MKRIKNHFIVFFVLPFIVTCKSQNNLTKDNYLEITHQKTQYFGKPYIAFTIKNISKKYITLFEPSLIIIEYKLDKEWNNLRILYCPCGASCVQPKERELISKNETYHLTWIQKEEWCGEKNNLGIPRTFSKKAEQGNYRIKIKYIDNNNSIKIKYYYFNLKNQP